ncbi:MAG: hypothetical protein Q9170_006899 [Blastenia crenularia]
MSSQFERCQRPPKELEKFVRWSDSSHGYNGDLDVGMSLTWDQSFADFLEKTWDHYPKNLDHNSGDTLGISVCQLSTRNGHRVTASEAFLSSRPSNLTIMTNAAVTKISLQGKKAVGVQVGEKQIFAKREVILSAGAVDSPKLLLLSGIGPSDDLKKLDIPIVQDLPGIGKNLHDHMHIFLITTQKPESHHRSSYIDSPEKLQEARKQYAVDQTGPLSGYYLPHMIGFVRSDKILESEEFKTLSKESQDLLRKVSKPTHEILSQNPTPLVKEPDLYLATAVVIPATESGGEVKLSSSDPAENPIVDPHFLSHPFDRRIAIQALRETMEFFQTPSLAKGHSGLAVGPKGEGDEKILEYIRETAVSTWHPCGTVKMGKQDDPGTCVDTNFRVVGMQGLRVVDMSVAPFVPSAHTQAVAYLIGETAAEKIVGEYE